MTTVSYTNKNIPLHTGYDVIVAGGGPAGCAAAISAARLGAKVLLIEQSGYLGGMGVGGLVPAWAPFSTDENLVYRSIAQEVFETLKGEMAGTVGADDIQWVPVHAEKLKLLYDRLVEESGADVLFFSTVIDCVHSERSIDSVIVANKGGLSAYQAKVFVDCTADGDVAVQAGCRYEKGGEFGALQSGSLCFALSGVNMKAYRAMKNQHAANKDSVIYKIVDDPKYPLINETHFCLNPISEDAVGFNAGHVVVDSTNPTEVSKAMILGRKIAVQLYQALKEYLPEVYGNSYLSLTAPMLGARESRRILGDYTLTLDDYLARRSFDDEIGRNCYYIDVHLAPQEKNNPDAPEAKPHYYGKGESHGIPYRCLIPADADNLLMAGRCISTDRPTQGSIRVMPTCLVTGEAAGAAAAMAAQTEGKVRDIDCSALRELLKQRGAYLK